MVKHIDIDTLHIVHYCHPTCVPFKNICRLPRAESFKLARELAEKDSESGSASRYIDFEKYYPIRKKVDKHLYDTFISLGGKPRETNPIYFVLHGSKSLEAYMGKWNAYRLLLSDIPSDVISFTLDDSIVSFKKHNSVTMYTKEVISQTLREYEGTIDEFLGELTEKHYCIEAQLWNDDYCTIFE